MTRKPTPTTPDQLRTKAIIESVIAIETMQHDLSHRGAVKATERLRIALAACQEMERRLVK